MYTHTHTNTHKYKLHFLSFEGNKETNNGWLGKGTRYSGTEWEVDLRFTICHFVSFELCTVHYLFFNFLKRKEYGPWTQKEFVSTI